MTRSSSSRPLPPTYADSETAWKFLEEGIHDVMTKGQSNYLDYMNLYTVSYNYCTSSGVPPSIQVPADLKLEQKGMSRSMLSCLDLYIKLKKYLAEHLKIVWEGAESLIDDGLLRYYAEEWDKYTIGAMCINRLFAFLNRHWVKPINRAGQKGIYTLYRVRLLLLFSLIDTFVSLGVEETGSNRQSLDVYDEYFETPFIAATEIYYRQESTGLLTINSVSDYLKKVGERLKEERDRASLYLPGKTWGPLVATCGHVLFQEHIGLIREELQKLFDFDKDEDLQRMYALLSRIPEGLEPLRKKFEEYVKRAGLAAVEKLVSGGDSNSEESIDPKAYVDALLEVHKKNSETVNRSFRGEAGFVASLDKACREFVNRNAATGSSSSKSPELLAKQADALLRKNNKMSEEGSLESALNQVMVIFKYIEDKDVFQNFYTNKLSKRLIHGASASDEAESSMISKLKEACGFEYTQKLQRMFTDMSLSKDLTDSFKEKMSVSHPEDSDLTFTIQVLGTNVWPLKSIDMNFVIPKEILPTFNRFQQYYQQKHSGRRLTWLRAYGKNELRSNYTSPQKFIFMTSSFQMAVLIQYNDYDSLSLEELQSNTGIPKDLLKQVLTILCKARVLLNDGEGEPYDLNPNYKSKKIRVNLNQRIKLAEKAESIEVLKNVDEDRKLALQATIVRIMKARKTMKNQEVIQEVISHVSAWFTPNIPDIKKAIDALLEQEYLKRVDDAHDIFAYVA
ncbi:hypothetical protein ACEPAG_3043 [Sanghuangporus baumii]